MAGLPYTQTSFEHLYSEESLKKLGAIVQTPKGVIKGLLMDIPSRAYGNNWSGSNFLDDAEELGSMAFGRAVSVAKQAMRFINSARREFGDGANSEVRVRDTVQYYQGPNNDKVSISLLMMKEFQGGDYKTGIEAAIRMSHPEEFTDYEGAIKPPASYNPSSYSGSSPIKLLGLDGVCTIAIRSHEILNGMLMDSCSIVSSPGLREDGEPIYRIVSMEFSSIRALDGNEAFDQYLTL